MHFMPSVWRVLRAQRFSQTELLILTLNAYCDTSFPNKPQGKASFEVLIQLTTKNKPKLFGGSSVSSGEQTRQNQELT